MRLKCSDSSLQNGQLRSCLYFFLKFTFKSSIRVLYEKFVTHLFQLRDVCRMYSSGILSNPKLLQHAGSKLPFLLAANLAAATTDTVHLHAQVDIREFLGGKRQTVDLGLLLSGRQIVMSIELDM